MSDVGILAIGLSLLVVVGCGDSKTDYENTLAGTTAVHDHAAHSHPIEGPHHGSLIELGNEEYHAELVHNEANGEVAIYLLDGHVEEAVAIKSSELKVNVSHTDGAQQFALRAIPADGDPTGKSSRFTSTDVKLAAMLDDHQAISQLVVTIGGKQYRGRIEHRHPH